MESERASEYKGVRAGEMDGGRKERRSEQGKERGRGEEEEKRRHRDEVIVEEEEEDAVHARVRNV